MDKLSVLRKYFGHSDFRAGQEALIDAILSGRDALGIMPTGAESRCAIRSRPCCCRVSRWSSHR